MKTYEILYEGEKQLATAITYTKSSIFHYCTMLTVIRILELTNGRITKCVIPQRRK